MLRTALRLPTPAIRIPVITRPTTKRSFHASVPSLIRVGDALPDLDVLMEGNPGGRVSLARELAGKDGVVVGVPAAFRYINHPKLSSAGSVFVVSVNDVFVMKAWGEALDPLNDSKIRFLADPTAEFTKALELDFDGSAIFGGARSKRYALLIKDGKVSRMEVEPDKTGLDVSRAEKLLS